MYNYIPTISILFLLNIFIGSSFNINDTSGSYLIAVTAQLLLGTPSSKYIGEHFLNFVLYGHDDIMFKYSDFMTNYGSIGGNPFRGSLVIGNDFKLSGIGLSPKNNSVAIPIPGSVITSVPVSNLSKFFPNGYTVIQSPYEFYLLGYGYENSTYNSQIACNDCMTYFSFPNNTDDVYSQYIFFEKFSGATPFLLTVYGYLQTYSSSFGIGEVAVYFYRTIYNDSDVYSLVDEQYYNKYSITNHRDWNMTYTGSVYVHFLDQQGYYNFTGNWSRSIWFN